MTKKPRSIPSVGFQTIDKGKDITFWVFVFVKIKNFDRVCAKALESLYVATFLEQDRSRFFPKDGSC
jgi:hypothetical protein